MIELEFSLHREIERERVILGFTVSLKICVEEASKKNVVLFRYIHFLPL